MGLGKRFSYKMSKEDQTTPGPGMYSNIAPNSIEKVSTTHKDHKSTYGFG